MTVKQSSCSWHEMVWLWDTGFDTYLSSAGPIDVSTISLRSCTTRQRDMRHRHTRFISQEPHLHSIHSYDTIHLLYILFPCVTVCQAGPYPFPSRYISVQCQLPISSECSMHLNLPTPHIQYLVSHDILHIY